MEKDKQKREDLLARHTRERQQLIDADKTGMGFIQDMFLTLMTYFHGNPKWLTLLYLPREILSEGQHRNHFFQISHQQLSGGMTSPPHILVLSYPI